MDNNTLYSHPKHYTLQSHLNVDYLILIQNSLYYLHLTDGEKGRHREFVTYSRSQSKLTAVFASGGAIFCPLKSRVFVPFQHFPGTPALERLQWGSGDVSSVGHSWWWLWRTMETALLPYYGWAESRARRERWLWLPPSWPLPPPTLPPPPKLGSELGNPKCKAPVSQAPVFLPYTPCLALLQAPCIPSPYSANMTGGLLCDRTCVRNAGNAARSHHPILVLSEFPAQYKVQVCPCLSSLHVIAWMSKAIRFPFKSTWAEQVAGLSWDSRPQPSSTTEQNCEVNYSRNGLGHLSLFLLFPEQSARLHLSASLTDRCGHVANFQPVEGRCNS